MKLREVESHVLENEELQNADVSTLNGTDRMNLDCTLG